MSKIIHTKKFMDGKVTPEELHQELAFPLGSRCKTCGRPPLIKIASFGEEAEMLKRDGNLKIFRMMDPDKYEKLICRTKNGRYMKLGEVFACKSCSKDAEVAAAKHPSWCFVEIDGGPGVDRIISGYGS